MRNWILGALILAAAAVMAYAGGTVTHFATLTYTIPGGPSWSDSGDLVGMHSMPSPVPGYSLIVFDFTDHSTVFHLDEGNTNLTFSR